MSTRVTRSSARSTPSLDPKTPEKGKSSPATTKAERQTPAKENKSSGTRAPKRVKATVTAEEEEEEEEEGHETVKGAIETTIELGITHVEAEAPDEKDTSKTASKAKGIEATLTEKTSKGQTSTRKRKAAEVTEETTTEMSPLAARTKGLQMFVGAHISAAKGVQNSIPNAMHIGANAWALFLKSQRKWDNPPLQAEHRDAFRRFCKEHQYDQAKHCLPHGSYLVNLAQEDPAKAKQAYTSFVDDLKRCDDLGIKLYNFHPGAAGQTTLESAMTRLAKALTNALKETSEVIPVLETMCGQGTVIGGYLPQFRDIFSQIPEEYHSRLGVCLDTCHSFAAGYDIRTKEGWDAFMTEFDETIGLKYLRALHMNDSKTPLASHRDLHANIGTGFLGLRAFHHIMNEPRLQGMPMILETPIDRTVTAADKSTKKTAKPAPAKIDDLAIWAEEIKLLESLIGMDIESDEFKSLEKKLSDKGKAEREKHQAQFDKKQAEAKRKEDKIKQRSLKDMFGAGAKSKKGVEN